jgi:hypothetical protein
MSLPWNPTEPFDTWLNEMLTGLRNGTLDMSQNILLMEFYLKWYAIEKNPIISHNDAAKWMMMGFYVYSVMEENKHADKPD